MVGEARHAREAWLILHGYGMLARGILHWFRDAARDDRLLVAPEALSRFYLDLSDRKRIVGASWTTREDLQRELDDQFAYLDRAVADCIPPELPLYVHGFSQGVSVATRWGVRTARAIESIACWAGIVPDDVTPAHLVARLGKRPVHFLVGDADGRVPPERVAADAERMRAGGVHAILTGFSGGHIVDPALLRTFAAR